MYWWSLSQFPVVKLKICRNNKVQLTSPWSLRFGFCYLFYSSPNFACCWWFTVNLLQNTFYRKVKQVSKGNCFPIFKLWSSYLSLYMVVRDNTNNTTFSDWLALDVFLSSTRGEQHIRERQTTWPVYTEALQENRCSGVTRDQLASSAIVLFPVMLFDLLKIAFQSRQSSGITTGQRSLWAICCVAAVWVFWLNNISLSIHTLFTQQGDYLWYLLPFPLNAVMFDFFVGPCSVWHKYNRLACV